MTTFQIMMNVYAIVALLSGVIIFFLTRDPKLSIRLLAALLIGLTWPMSLPVALLFSLF